VDQVEEAIRRAEELMSKDLEMLSWNETETEETGMAVQVQGSDDEDGFQVGSMNRYRDADAREGLIQQLLKEREEVLEAKLEADRLAEELDIKELERRRVEELDKLANPVQRFEVKSNVTKAKVVSKTSTGHGKSSAPKKAKSTPPIKKRTPVERKKISSSSSNDDSGPSEKQHSFCRKSLDQVKRQVEMERQRDCTFKPNIKKYAKVKPETLEERMERLSRPRNEYWRKIEEQRAKLESEKNKTCTFKPDISLAKSVGETQPAKDIGEEEAIWKQRVKDAYRNHVPVERRLHLDASERWVARDRARRELEDAELQAQPFRPKVNEVSEEIARQIDYEPIEKRAGRVQREKQERIARRKLEVELNNPDLTFQPVISEASGRIASSASLRRGEPPAKNVVDRLLSKPLQERKNSREQAWAEQQERECRFHPKVSSNSKKIVESHPAFKKATDFVQRQEIMENERKDRERERRAAAHDMSGVATFRPKVHNPDRILVQSRPERLAETEAQRYERLAYKDQQRKMKLQNYIRDVYYSQYEFKPKINRVSKEIVRDTHKKGQACYDSLYKNERGKYYREVAQSQIEEEVLRECTFQPETLSRPNATASDAIRKSRKQSEQTIRLIEQSRRKKENRLQQQRLENEYEELKECTFTPLVNNDPSSLQRDIPVVVNGLGRYMELRELAKRQVEEQREREAKIFMEDMTSVRPEPYTVPQPFNLSEAPQSSTRRKYTGELPHDCTFQPKTNLSKTRRELNHILGS